MKEMEQRVGRECLTLDFVNSSVRRILKRGGGGGGGAGNSENLRRTKI